MPEQKETTARGKTKDVGFVRDGSSASRAIPPGESKPGWDMSTDDSRVVHSEVKPYQ